MSNERLFEMLAEAYSRPSKAYQATELGFKGVRETGDALDAYGDREEKLKQRKLAGMTLREHLGRDLPGLEEFGDLRSDQIKAVSPLSAFLRDDREKEPKSLGAILARDVNSGRMTIDDALKKQSAGMLAGRGFELGDDGELIQLPGGEPHRKTAAKEKATQSLSGKIETLRTLYRKLDENEGIVSTERGALSNIRSSLAASRPGQKIGKVIGSKDQSLRNQINSTLPLIINDIRQASEMGARGLDSERELEFYLQAASQPQADVQANLAVLDGLEKAYGKWQAELAEFNRTGGGGRKVKVSNGTETLEIDANDLPSAIKDGYKPI